MRFYIRVNKIAFSYMHDGLKNCEIRKESPFISNISANDEIIFFYQENKLLVRVIENIKYNSLIDLFTCENDALKNVRCESIDKAIIYIKQLYRNKEITTCYVIKFEKVLSKIGN